MSTETEQEEEEYVTVRACRDRHATTKWTLGVFVGLVAVFLTGAIYAINCAHDTGTKAGEVSATLESHMAAQAEMERHFMQRLEEIRADVRDNRTLLQEILRNGRKQP